MSSYFVINKLVRQTEKAILVQPQGGAGTQWFPKAAVGLWDTGEQLILGIEDWASLPEAAVNWQTPGMSAGQIIDMKMRTAPVNLYTHIAGYTPEAGV